MPSLCPLNSSTFPGLGVYWVEAWGAPWGPCNLGLLLLPGLENGSEEDGAPQLWPLMAAHTQPTCPPGVPPPGGAPPGVGGKVGLGGLNGAFSGVAGVWNPLDGLQSPVS